MSIKISALVWKHLPDGGNVKLIALALADWADDDGGSLYPSLAALAAKCGCSRDQAKRVLRGLIDRKLVQVVRNEKGGKPGTTRHYQINVGALTGGADAPPTGGTDAPRLTGERGACTPLDGGRTCTGTGGVHAPQDVSYPLFNREGDALRCAPAPEPAPAPVSKPKPPRAAKRTRCPDTFEVTERMVEWALQAGVPEDRVIPETEKFLDHFRGKGQLQADWAATWRNWMRKAAEFATQGRYAR